MKKQPSNIKLRSEEVQDILSFVPHWMIRWGSFLFFIVLIMIFGAAAFIHYPEVVVAPVRIVQPLPERQQLAPLAAYVEHVLVTEGDVVEKGEPFLALQSQPSNGVADTTQLLYAAIQGKVFYYQQLILGQQVALGQPLCLIVPEGEQVLGIADISSNGYEKVVEGQAVQIKLDAYPHYSFGTLNGKISRLSKVSTGHSYEAIVQLNNGLHSSFHQELPFRPDMKGTVEIIVGNRSLLDRLLVQFKL